jgi:hypothetical protein
VDSVEIGNCDIVGAVLGMASVATWGVRRHLIKTARCSTLGAFWGAGSDETIIPHRETILKHLACTKAPLPNGEPAMNTIVANVLKSEAVKAQAGASPLKIIAIFCGAGLLASLCLVAVGIDLGAGFF